jgi:FkbM family methyltransferase
LLIRSKKLRTLGRSVPGLEPAYRVALRLAMRRRGVGRLDYAGTPLRIRVTSDEIVQLRLRPVAKEPWTVEWIEHNARDGDVLYDVGANVGAYSLIGAVAAETRVVAIEPAFANFAALCENVLLNDLADRVLPLPIVLAESSRIASLGSEGTHAGAAVHALDREGSAYSQPVLAFALDDLVGSFGAPQPTLMKIDVDGAEVAVLAGAAAVLRDPALRSLVIEAEDANTDAVIRLLQEAGFTLARRIDERYGERLPGVWYGVFGRAVPER